MFHQLAFGVINVNADIACFPQAIRNSGFRIEGVGIVAGKLCDCPGYYLIFRGRRDIGTGDNREVINIECKGIVRHAIYCYVNLLDVKVPEIEVVLSPVRGSFDIIVARDGDESSYMGGIRCCRYGYLKTLEAIAIRYASEQRILLSCRDPIVHKSDQPVAIRRINCSKACCHLISFISTQIDKRGHSL